MLKNVLILAQVLLMGAAGWFAWGLAAEVQRMGEPPSIPAAAEALPAAATEALKGRAAFQVIADRNLFQLPAREGDAPQTIDVDALAPTSLQLKLWGTVSGNGEEAYAVIEDPALRRQAVYRPGEMVQHAVVRLILREKIVLSVDGRDEVLLMEQVLQGSGAAGEGGFSAARASQSSLAGKEPDPHQLIILASRLWENLPQEPAALQEHGQWQAEPEDGGLRLLTVAGNSIFAKLGLRAGDLLRRADDEEIAGLEDLQRFMTGLATTGMGLVEIQRGSETIQIRYEPAAGS